MCGISGIVTKDQLTLREVDRVSDMNDALRHRGPDGSGAFSSTHVALAARRLAVIDLAYGQQPFTNHDESLVLIANGEIYNHADLRSRLETRGHVFKSHNDCETILHAYAEFGSSCVEELRGMFAFALWDEPKQKLLLARDRMGEKPLYLYVRDGIVAFASEMKALLRSGLVSFELDPQSVDLYFHYQYVPEPRTAIKGVRKLDAATLLTIDVDRWHIDEKRYWSMETAPVIDRDAPVAIREALETIAKTVTNSDVPVGVALSGGLDSSVVASLASRQLGDKIAAFSVGYAGQHPSVDERGEARALADHLSLPFHEIEIDITEMVEFFPALNYWRDDPIADYSGHSYYAVTRRAREVGVPVMLQGHGGDELFWGYPALRDAAIQSIRKQNPNVLGHVVALSRAALGKPPASGPDQLRFYDVLPDYQEAEARASQFYNPAFVEQLNGHKPAGIFTVSRPWSNIEVTMTRLVSDTYLRGNGVVQGDRLAMKSSVEMRLPFLDHILVETIVGLRKHKSDLHLAPKTWLRQAMIEYLPEFVFARPKKGFAPPVNLWHQALFAAHGDSLNGGYLTQHEVLTDKSAAELSQGAFPTGLTSPLSFKALVLEQWCRQMSAIQTRPCE